MSTSAMMIWGLESSFNEEANLAIDDEKSLYWQVEVQAEP